ncbi:NDR1/HIN1-like protein 3 [Iris pallida]|uniref:NDR1/HIN1-like protein 3 n=1 Tax=Iris pallida TaxID=29817 RepID=A0AAX6HFK7_IRIPA|nr:NDR1/HIN1-like protein 3 [Iris pallida]
MAPLPPPARPSPRRIRHPHPVQPNQHHQRPRLQPHDGRKHTQPQPQGRVLLGPHRGAGDLRRVQVRLRPLPAFYQGHRTTTTLHPAFRGQQAAPGSVAGTFEREKGEGSFYVQVELSTKLRIKVLRFVKLGHFKPRKIDCVVKLPVPGSSGSFERTKCHVDWF